MPAYFYTEGRRSNKLADSHLNSSQRTSATDDLRNGPSSMFWKCSWAKLQIVEVHGPIIDDLRYTDAQPKEI